MSKIGFHRHSLSLKLGLTIVLFVVVLFVASLGLLFLRSRQLVREEALERASKVLDKTALRVSGYLCEVESASKNIEWLIHKYPIPDSLLAYSRRVVALNPDIGGCSITMEPDFFPSSVGRYSAYTIRRGSDIITQREGDYNYYGKVWYNTAKLQEEPCWIDPFDDYNPGTLYNSDMIVSYSVPLTDRGNRFIGIISTDLSLTWLSKTITEEKPYPHSYSIMLGRNGNYYVHPDPTKLVKHTIFSAAAPDEQAQINVLGHRMLAGNDDYMRLTIDGEPCYVFFQPLQQTGWSIALVCPEKDILGGYNRLGYIIFGLLVTGLVLMLLFFMRTFSRFTEPLMLFVSQSQHIASGHFTEPMPLTRRSDLIGRLQNSFSIMQQSLAEQVGRLQQANDKAEEHNRELQRVNRLAQEAQEQKLAFLQDVSHQIRTPLNIIQGFLNVVLKDDFDLTLKEKEHIINMIQRNAFYLRRMAYMLYDASRIETGLKQLDYHDIVSCNDVARKAINAISIYTPFEDNTVIFETSIDNDVLMRTDDKHLYYIIHELLFNAKRFAPGNPVRLTVYETPGNVNYAVEDEGPGIPKEARPHIFDHFFKHSSFTEGLGLGLYLCRHYIRLLGGELSYDTTYEKGSRFIIRLPLTID